MRFPLQRWWGGDRKRRTADPGDDSTIVLAAAFEEAPVGLAVLRPLAAGNNDAPVLRVEAVNRRAREFVWLGLRLGEDLAGTRLARASHDGVGRCETVLRTGVPDKFELRWEAGERPCWLEISVAPDGGGLVLAIQEVTERRLTEERLRRDRALLEMTGQMTKSGGWEVLYPEEEIRWSPEVHVIHEVPLDYEPSMREALDFYAPESVDAITEAYGACVRDGTPFDLELELITARKQRIWVRAMGRAEFAAGRLRRIYGTFQDITRERRIIHEHQQDLLRLEKITASLPCAVYHYCVRADGAHAFLYVSERIRDVYDRTPEEMLRDVERGYDLIHPEDVERVRHSALPGADGERAWRHEFRIDRRGEVRWVLDESTAQVFADGSVHWFGFLMDVTEQRRVREQLVEARDAAEAASRAKGDFLAVMSHEIRTPMNGMLGFAELLAQADLPPEELGYARTIVQSGSSMLRIINDILDYSRIEAGRLETEKADFPLARVVQDVASVFRAVAEEKGISLRATISPELPLCVWGDEARLRQILMNLTGNAVKFTARGGVEIEVRPADGEICFFVRDTGPGIPSEKLGTIFEPFVQGDSSIARRYGGTGLGLAIAHRLVSLLGGKLHVASGESAGTEFSFHLKLPPVSTAGGETGSAGPKMDASFASAHPLRILVAEDDAVNQRLICKVLQRLGYVADCARDGHLTVERWREVRHDCILMDMQMPGVDGVEAAMRIRSEEGAARGVYISALTANVLPTERLRCRDAGMDDYLAKPLDLNELVRVLRTASERRQAATAG